MKRAILSKPIEEIVPDLRTGSVRLVSAGRTFLSVPASAVAAEQIAIGMVVGEAQMERLAVAADRDAAYRTAIRLLERRPFAKADLGRRLGLKGHSSEAVAAALDRAEQAGYLDDARFAQQYVESRLARGRGPARLKRELAVMGVAKDLVDRAITKETSDPGLGQDRIRQLIAKRMPQLKDRPRPESRRRLLAFLARRGYSGHEVLAMVRAALP